VEMNDSNQQRIEKIKQMYAAKVEEHRQANGQNLILIQKQNLDLIQLQKKVYELERCLNLEKTKNDVKSVLESNNVHSWIRRQKNSV
jgi:hypothetical protein